MNLKDLCNKFCEWLDKTMINLEQTLFNWTVRPVAHLIERLTGFNCFDLVFALNIICYMNMVIGCFLSLTTNLRGQRLAIIHKRNLVTELDFIWMVIALMLTCFVCEYIARVRVFRKQLFYAGHLDQAVLRLNNDRVWMVLPVILTISANHLYQGLGIKMIFVTAPALYITLGLAKAEPYYNWFEQRRRIGSLFRVIYLLIIVIVATFVGIFSRRLDVLYEWNVLGWYIAIASFVLIALISFKIAELHEYIHRIKPKSLEITEDKT